MGARGVFESRKIAVIRFKQPTFNCSDARRPTPIFSIQIAETCDIGAGLHRMFEAHPDPDSFTVMRLLKASFGWASIFKQTP